MKTAEKKISCWGGGGRKKVACCTKIPCVRDALFFQSIARGLPFYAREEKSGRKLEEARGCKKVKGEIVRSARKAREENSEALYLSPAQSPNAVLSAKERGWVVVPWAHNLRAREG